MPACMSLRLPRCFIRGERPDWPTVSAREPGLGLALAEVEHAPDRVCCLALVTVGLPANEHGAFRDIEDAVVLLAEDPTRGLHAALKLRDPDRQPLPTQEDGNYTPPASATPSVVFARNHFGVPLEITWEGELDAAHPGVYLHLALHGRLSRVVALPLRAPPRPREDAAEEEAAR